MVCTNGTRRIQILRTAHSIDFRAECFGNLHGKGAYAAGRAVDENLLPRLNLSLMAQTLQCGECCYRNSRGLLNKKVWALAFCSLVIIIQPLLCRL
jgi:hypothetical protein